MGEGAEKGKNIGQKSLPFSLQVEGKD